MLVRKLNTFLVSIVIVALLAGCAAPAAQPTEPAAGAGGDKITIGVTMKFDDLWLTTLRDAMTEYAATQPGVELVMVDSKEDVATQLGQVENFVAQRVDAIIIIPANTDAADPMTKAAQDAGIPLVYVNRIPSNLPEGVAYVGSDSIQAGIMQAEWLAEQLGGKGNVVIMNGDLAQEAAQKRTEGEKQVFAKFPDIQDHQRGYRQLEPRPGPGLDGKLACLRRSDRCCRFQ